MSKLMKKFRFKFRDSLQAFPFRMGVGFAGDVNRTHPASIEPVLIDATNPPLLFGRPVFLDGTSNNARQAIAGDGSATPAFCYGFAVRPFPINQPSGSTDTQQQLGDGVPPTNHPLDVLRSGYMYARVNVGSAPAPVKGAYAFVRCAATSGNHIQGQLETAQDSTNNLKLTNVIFNSPADANGIAEVYITSAPI